MSVNPRFGSVASTFTSTGVPAPAGAYDTPLARTLASLDARVSRRRDDDDPRVRRRFRASDVGMGAARAWTRDMIRATRDGAFRPVWRSNPHSSSRAREREVCSSAEARKRRRVKGSTRGSR
jgi:hypothetical protein